MQDHARGFPHDIADHIAQCEIRILQGFLNAIDLSRLLFGQSDAIARQITQLALRNRGDEARFEKAMLQKIIDPFGVLDICLSTRDSFDMLRIDYQHGKTAFQQVKHWLPIHTSHNVAKDVIKWEYTTQILRSDLRTRLRDQLQTSPPRSPLFHEGSCPQGPGALYVQRAPSSASTSGGDCHV